jgi:hypothetical protein
MEQFELFDQVQLTEAISLCGEMSNALEPLTVAPVGTTGTIVEVLDPDEAFLVELFGDWVSLEDEAGLKRSTHDNPTAFRETLGVEVVKATQMNLLHRPSAIKGNLFLQHRQQRTTPAAQTPTRS